MPDTVQTSLPPMTKEDKKKGKKRVHLLVEGRYVESGSEFLCQECSRTFPTEQVTLTRLHLMRCFMY
ncbi:hypothetical protein EON65_12590 [archaeon]|nr:MAG: hypothetical protein EON65_12590 [archaeon]